MAHGFIGFAKYLIGRGEETEAHVEEAIRLSPRDTHLNAWMTWAGFGKHQIGADEEAVARFRRSIEPTEMFRWPTSGSPLHWRFWTG